MSQGVSFVVSITWHFFYFLHFREKQRCCLHPMPHLRDERFFITDAASLLLTVYLPGFLQLCHICRHFRVFVIFMALFLYCAANVPCLSPFPGVREFSLCHYTWLSGFVSVCFLCVIIHGSPGMLLFVFCVGLCDCPPLLCAFLVGIFYFYRASDFIPAQIFMLFLFRFVSCCVCIGGIFLLVSALLFFVFLLKGQTC